MTSNISYTPKYGWKAKFNKVFPDKRKQDYRPPIRVILKLLLLIINYVIYTLWMYIKRRMPVMDYIKVVQPDMVYGVPLGGLGGGTIGRGFRGEFCRYQLKPGIYEYGVIDGDQFIVTVQNEQGHTIYQSVLSPRSPPKDGKLSSWKWNFPANDAHYTALYPRSWTEYFISELNVKLTCRQVCPVIPRNYKDSCVPGAVFVWTVENNSHQSLYVSITFTFESYSSGINCDPFEYTESRTTVAGVQIHDHVSDMKCTFVLAATKTNEVDVSSTCFCPNSNGQALWEQLMEKGRFTKNIKPATHFYGKMGCAVCTRMYVPVNSTSDSAFSLIWDMPKIHFRGKKKSYVKYYTKYFNCIERKESYIIGHYALSNYKKWEEQIEDWQRPTLNDDSLPDWYKSAIFNELYYIADGGTIWILMNEDELNTLPENDTRREYGRFAYLEGQEYRMYNTYDVHFYASFALADLWPMLQLTIQCEFNNLVNKTDNSLCWYLYNAKIGRRKYPCCIPHDVGDPDDEPFLSVNAYPIHNVTGWRDLNLKFILQCYRDYAYTKDERYLADMWPQIKLLMDICLQWDINNDGMIENDDSPDQTYDCWSMTGVSAYIGTLWIATLYCAAKMAYIMKEDEIGKKYTELLEKAKIVLNSSLWDEKNGYYIFDTSGASHSLSIMSDQLCGLWYLRASGITEEVLPLKRVQRALKTIFDYNVSKFVNGTSGAINGMTPDGKPDEYTVQSVECWTGVTYALAALYIFEGVRDKGFKTAQGVYETVYDKIGMSFQTPEALYEHRDIRAVGYMRSLSIWSMQIALRKSGNVFNVE